MANFTGKITGGNNFAGYVSNNQTYGGAMSGDGKAGPIGPQGPQGPQGNPGPTGEAGNGIENIELIGTLGKEKTYRITFTDGTHFDYIVRDGNDGTGGGGGSGDMLKSIYDTNDNGIVDNAEKVNGHTVLSDVPANAKFTDTVYDDASIKNDIANLQNNKVDKVTGKSLIADSEITRLAGVTNYNDTAVKNDITELQNNKADKTAIPTVPTNVSAFTNDAGYIKGYTETDPTVPGHVKNITTTDISNWNNKSNFSGNYNDLSNQPTIPTTTSQLTNDSNFISSTVVTAFVFCTQAEYDALSNKDSTTLYLVPKE